MANKNNINNPFEDIEILKALLYLQQEQQNKKAQNKKVLSVEEYAKQAVNELLTKVGISYDSET